MNGTGAATRTGDIGSGIVGSVLLCGQVNEFSVYEPDGFADGTQRDHGKINRWT